MRLIDADKLKAHYAWWGDSDETKRLFDTIIYRQPTVDAEPVRHGRWEKNNDGIMIWWECSECHHDAWYDKDNMYNYCPNCGAKMDGGGE